MSDSFSDYDEDSNWTLDLETSLLENCDFIKLRTICQDRSVPKHLRYDVWKICLNINTQNIEDSLESFNDLFDLPNQDILHEKCCQLVSTLPKDIFANRIGFINDLECILTHFSHKYNMEFQPDNGWLNILKVLCCELKLNKRSELYNFFVSISHRFLPSNSVCENDVASVFRLLIQYHDPELCSFLDTHKISPDFYAQQWFSYLFSSDIQHEALVQLWDSYFLISDPFLMFYLALVVVLNLKETLLEMRGEEKSKILNKIKSVLCQMSVDDVGDFRNLAQIYVTQTPKSFIRLFSSILFGNGNRDSEFDQLLTNLCMPISVHELLESKSSHDPDSIRYFLIDCRPAEQYNAGHLPSAYFLDSSLILSSPHEEFQLSVQSLLETQENALKTGSESGGEHICFLGSGDIEDDQLVNMVVAQFLQKMTKYVSLVYGGYRGIHDVLGPQCGVKFVGHNSKECIVCGKSGSLTRPMRTGFSFNSSTSNQDALSTTNKVGGLLSKVGSALKTNSYLFKDKFANYVKNSDQHQMKNSVKPPTNRPYRNTGANIFSIDDEIEEDNNDLNYLSNFEVDNKSKNVKDDKPKQDIVNLDFLIKQLNALDTFECYVVDTDGSMHPGYLLLTEKFLFILKKSASTPLESLSNLFGVSSAFQTSGKSPQTNTTSVNVSIYRKRILHSVVKITSRKKIPECLTFHFILPNETVEKDRYVVHKAGEAAKAIKIQVQKRLDEAEMTGFDGAY